MIEVTDKGISLLGDKNLTKLAHLLLIAEARASGIALGLIECSFNITTGDGGEDASIRWEGGADKTDYLFRDTLVQIKATPNPDLL